jgi:hypothetical protein
MRNMSLPNLGALRLTAPTSELFPITAEDQEKDNGGEPFEDPTDFDELPLGSQTRTFRVEKVPGNPERGYNWHNAKTLAKWVRQQIEERKFPVVDPYRTPMSKSDIDQLRFEIDQDIPPYDPSVPPPVSEPSDEDLLFFMNPVIDPDDPAVALHEWQIGNVVRMELFTDYARVEGEVDPSGFMPYNRIVIGFTVKRNANEDLFASLRKFFMSTPYRDSSEVEVQNSDFDLNSSVYHPQAPPIAARILHLRSQMRWLNNTQNHSFDTGFDRMQTSFRWTLQDLGGTIIRETLGPANLTEDSETTFGSQATDDEIRFRWQFSWLNQQFFEDIRQSFRFMVPDDEGSWHGPSLQPIIDNFRTLFESILWENGKQTRSRPRFPMFQQNNLVLDGQGMSLSILHHLDVEDRRPDAELQLPPMVPSRRQV